jgi:hypothetical protein
MALTADDLVVIDRAIAMGEQTVVFADRSVTYRSISDLLKARAIIVAALAGRNRQTLGYSDKGFET